MFPIFREVKELTSFSLSLRARGVKFQLSFNKGTTALEQSTDFDFS